MDILKRCAKTPVLVRKAAGPTRKPVGMRRARGDSHHPQGIATAEDVDLAVKNGFGLRLVWSVLEHADAVGLDLVKSVQDCATALRNETFADPLLTQKVEEGLGTKQAWLHDWTVRDMSAAKARRDEFLVRFLRVKEQTRTSE
jgi:3-hydroxyacyl-CoA dehydrogenase